MPNREAEAIMGPHGAAGIVPGWGDSADTRDAADGAVAGVETSKAEAGTWDPGRVRTDGVRVVTKARSMARRDRLIGNPNGSAGEKKTFNH